MKNSSELLYSIALNLLENSPLQIRKYIDAFGSPKSALNNYCGGKFSKVEIESALNRAKAELESAHSKDIAILCESSPSYPKLLREIPDRPIVLYVKGKLPDAPSIAIVGSRKADAYCMSTSEKISKELSEAGFAIISGLAYGVDAAAHKSSVASKGKTVAVLGSGLCDIYPREHQLLAKKIIECDGAIVSEFALLAGPERQNFPKRNRIIAGISLGVIVVAAAKRSGALITARLAMEYNRNVWAVPHRFGDELGEGVIGLMRDGATVISKSSDILEDLALQMDISSFKKTAPNSKDEVLTSINADGSTLDEIALKTGLERKILYQRILQLELEGKIISIPGGLYRLTC